MTIPTKPDFLTDTRLQDCLEYLDELRDSGVTNMFGARPYLQAEFRHLTTTEAGKILAYWMRTFSERHKEEA